MNTQVDTGRAHRPFIPAWLDDAELSLPDVRVLVHLWRRAGKKCTCWPSAPSIAQACHLRVATVWGSIARLETAGFLTRRKHWRNSNEYVLTIPPVSGNGGVIQPPESVRLRHRFNPLNRSARGTDSGDSVVAVEAPPVVAVEAPPVVAVEAPPSVSTEVAPLKVSSPPAPLAASPSAQPQRGEESETFQLSFQKSGEKEPAKERPRDELFDGLASACGSDPKQMTSREARSCAVALAEIRKVCPTLTPEEIARRAKNYRESHKTWPLTPNALCAHWGESGQTAPTPVRRFPERKPDYTRF